jgi:hypothetical protein
LSIDPDGSDVLQAMELAIHRKQIAMGMETAVQEETEE